MLKTTSAKQQDTTANKAIFVKEQENMIYRIYVNGHQVHECTGVYEAHTVFTNIFAIKEWSWLPIHVNIDNGLATWGTSPEALAADLRQARRHKSNRTRYLNSVDCSEEERELSASRQLAKIIEQAKR